MAGKVAINVDFRFGSAGSESTKVDNSAKSRSVDFPREQDLQDITPFGSSAKQFAPGLSNATIKADFFWDITIEAQINALIGNLTAVDFTFGPDGTTAANPKYTGSMFLKSIGTPVKIGDVKTCTVDFQVTGAITRTTY